MKTKLIYLFFFLILTNFTKSVQAQKVTKADKNFADYSYVDATKFYKHLIKKGNIKESRYAKLGDSYYNVGDYKEAANWYSKMMEANTASQNANYLYRYAQALKSSQDYEKSNTIMEQLGSLAPNDKRYIAYKKNKNYLTTITSNSNKYTIKNLAINTEYSDFAVSKINDSMLVFSSNRDTGLLKKKIHLWKNQSFNKLFNAKVKSENEISDIKALKNNFLHNLTITTTTFSKDGKIVYFTKNNSNKSKFKRDNKNVSNLKIYKADIVNGIWTNIVDLPFNSDNYSNAHPSLSADDNVLYFASDMPGSLGKSDIYKVTINNDGSFGVPENLGDKINTESRESYPHITENNILYFTSDGQPGLGGLDIFAVKLDNQTQIENLGQPINSSDDDFSFSINHDTHKGYFSSKRDGGKGSDDIYSFTEIETLVFSKNIEIKGVITSKTTKEPLSNISIMLIDENEQLVHETITKDDGTYLINEELEESNYKIVTTHTNYVQETKNLKVNSLTKTEEVNFTLSNIPKKIEIGTDLKKHLSLDTENIYFNFDKVEILSESKPILNKIVTLMKEMPNLKIEIKSHTDAIGNAEYNKILSERRAQSTLDYFVENGIDISRLTASGIGESELTNDCFYGVKCTEQEHQKNRRSEFIVTEQ